MVSAGGPQSPPRPSGLLGNRSRVQSLSVEAVHVEAEDTLGPA